MDSNMNNQGILIDINHKPMFELFDEILLSRKRRKFKKS